jgi:peptidoglycan LD-endopeptidase LytH
VMAALRVAVALTGLTVLTALVWPWIDDAIYLIRLVSDDRPQALLMPVAGVPRIAVRDTWGAPRPGGRRHEGVDISARRGTPVVATTRGLIWNIGENSLGGRVVWVRDLPARQRRHQSLSLAADPVGRGGAGGAHASSPACSAAGLRSMILDETPP